MKEINKLKVVFYILSKIFVEKAKEKEGKTRAWRGEQSKLFNWKISISIIEVHLLLLDIITW